MKITENMKWIAQKFKEYVAQEGSTDAYLRGLHYFIVSLPEDKRWLPQKTKTKSTNEYKQNLYENTKAQYGGLSEYMKKLRIAGLIPFTALIDKKNDPIARTVFDRPKPHIDYISTDTDAYVEFNIESMIDFNNFIDNVALNYNPAQFYLQTHRLCLMIEKAKAKSSLEQLCKKYGADFIHFSGQASITRLYEITKLAKDENKPLRVLYVSDLDVAGWFMPDAAQNNISQIYPNPNNELHRVCLLKNQAEVLNLPPSFDTNTKGYHKTLIKRFHAESGSDDCIEVDAVPLSNLLEIVEIALQEHAFIDEDKELSKQFEEDNDRRFEQIDLSIFEDEYTELYNNWGGIIEEYTEFKPLELRANNVMENINNFEERIDDYVRTQLKQLKEAE